MKTIFRIAETELRLFFYSPIAWLILIIFAFQAGMAFCDSLGFQLQNKALGRDSIPYQTILLLLIDKAAFYKMLSNLYLYIPLLTMALMSREYSSGSIKLLYSSPVTTRQIIGGKFLAMVIYGVGMLAFLLLQTIFAAVFVKNLDLPLAFSGILGIFLVLCAYSAIGLFMSVQTSYQIVAAIGTLVVLSFLNFIGGLWQNVPFVRELTWWLSISGRAKTFLSGLICSEDVMYFLIIIALFLALSVLKLQSQRRHCSIGWQISRYGGVVCVALGLGYLTSRPLFMHYYDATATKHNTITEEGQRVMGKMDDRLTITMYVNLLDKNYWLGMPERQMSNLRELKPFLRFKPDTRLEYVYFYDHTDNSRYTGKTALLSLKEQMLKACDDEDLDPELFLSPEEIRQRIDLTAEGNRTVYQLKRADGRTTFLRFYDGSDVKPRETEITVAMKCLVTDVPKVAFVTGHGERSLFRKDEEGLYSLLWRNRRNALVNQGFVLDTLSLAGRLAIPEDIDILVISAPEKNFRSGEVELLNAYMAKGGNLIIAGEPGKQEVVNELVKGLGVRYKAGELLQKDMPDLAENLIVADISDAGIRQTGIGAGVKAWNYQVAFPGTTALTFAPESGFVGAPVVEYAGDTLMLVLRRQLGEKEQRIVVSGDSDWFSSGGLSIHKENVSLNNFGLFMEMLHYMTYGEFPVDNGRLSPMDNALYLDHTDIWWIKGFFIYLIPIVLLVAALWFTMKRKKQ
ncbi:MAG: Gldg family protein [Odoribacter sp.]|nr:Gldg family protein [Odoribacter sp.]